MRSARPSPAGRVIPALILATALSSGCAGGRLSSDDARRQIAEIGGSKLVPDAIAIRRLSERNDREVIAETSVELTFQFRRKDKDSPWRVAAVRLGGANWVDVGELLAGIDEVRRKKTAELVAKLSAGVEAYRRTNGNLPPASAIGALSDLLYPRYMNELVRNDAWGNPILYKTDGTTYSLEASPHP